MAGGKFLQRVSLEKAREAAIASTSRTDIEQIAVEAALGRITGDAIFARLPSPHYRASAMDGIAVRSADLVDASAAAPVSLAEAGPAHAADADGPPVFAAVDTGSPLPEWADAVVRIENVARAGDLYLVGEPLPPGRDVRPIGEDIQAGALLLSSGHTIRPYDIGAMLAAGLQTVPVRRRPTVAMLATGTEVIEPDDERTAGKVVEYNSRVMSAYVSEWGGEPRYLGRIPDDPAALAKAIVDAAKAHDIVAVIAGSSVGRKDFTVDAIAQYGELLVHGVDIMPGKPASVARVEGKPVIGIPGYPVSAIVVYQQLLAPVIAHALGIAPSVPASLEAEVRRKIPSRLGVEEFVRVCIAHEGDHYVATPLARGAGSITTVVRADGVLRIGSNVEGIDTGSRVRIELLRTFGELEHSVVVAGRPDRFASTLETVAQRELVGLRFAYLPVAAYDSVVALERGEAELAIVQVNDENTQREVAGLLSDRLGACTAYRVRKKDSDGGRIIILGRMLGERLSGTALLNALASNTFPMELETLEEFQAGLAMKRISPS